MSQHRNLTAAEAACAQRIFRGSIPTGFVTVSVMKHVFGGFTPYGRINVGPGTWLEDFVAPVQVPSPPPASIADAHLFLHEMVHVWQHFVGMAIVHEWTQARASGRRVLRETGKARYAFNRDAGTYAYAITADQPDLLDYNMEQQGDIIADYYAHVLWGRRLDAGPYNIFGYPTPTRAQLAGVLARFIENPAYPMLERGLWAARARFRSRPRRIGDAAAA